MASVNSVSSGSTSGLKGFGGLASGLDTDSLIEGMTAGTRARIAKQLQSKQIYQWKMDAYRSVSDKLIEFSRKYLEMSSSSCLRTNSAFSKSLVTAMGENSKYISVSGSSSQAESLMITAVKKLAQDAKLTSNGAVSDSTLQSGEIDFSSVKDVSTLAGKSFTVTIGKSEKYTVKLLDKGTVTDASGKETEVTYDYTTMEGAIKGIQASIDAVNISGGKKLSDELTVSASGNSISFGKPSGNTIGNTVTVTDRSDGILSLMGFGDKVELGSAGEVKTGDKAAELTKKETFADRVAGKTLTLSYNGVTKTITMPSKEDFDKALSGIDLTDQSPTNKAEIDRRMKDCFSTGLQEKLDNAFGNGRVKFDEAKLKTDGVLSFKTTKPDGTVDDSSVLKVSNASAGLLGDNGVLSLNYGESNRGNLNVKFSQSGLKGSDTALDSYTYEENGKKYLNIWINGKQVKGVSENSSVGDIVNAINNSDTGVTVSYMESSDKFVIKSKQSGAGGEVTFGKTDGTGKNNFAALLFGGASDDSSVLSKVEGQDAEIVVKNKDTGTEQTLYRGSNTFDLEGLTVTVNGEFTAATDAEAITFSAKADTEKLVKNVKEMIDDYNELIELVNKEMTTKPNRSYPPLTDEQKADMTEDQIKVWEEKAKAGMLFNDSDLRGVADSLRFVFTGSAPIAELESMGISVSTDYKDNGKITFDETKFEAALNSNMDRVREIFTAPDTDKNGGGGISNRLKAVTDKYASTTGFTKGILIEKAGSTYAPTSVLQNSLLKQMDSIDDIVEGLKRKLKTEQDRYQRQFTTLEQVISQMNSQSSYLSQMSGGM